jgi:hypothetical protein
LPDKNTRNLNASNAEEYPQEREKLVNELAKAFIHETAHMWQLRQYSNESHPWTLKKVDIAKENPQTLPPGEIAMFIAPEDVQRAFKELNRGGKGGAAKNDPEVKRALRVMTGPTYYQPGESENAPIRDQRARELVSHLIEIVYVWPSPGEFQEVFPECSKLLDRVISRGADVS